MDETKAFNWSNVKQVIQIILTYNKMQEEQKRNAEMMFTTLLWSEDYFTQTTLTRL